MLSAVAPLSRMGMTTLGAWVCMFRCPCDERQVYVASPPHTIKFDADGVVDIKASCGYRKKDNPPRPANWCHFFINDGVPEMCGDAKCPGGSGGIA